MLLCGYNITLQATVVLSAVVDFRRVQGRDTLRPRRECKRNFHLPRRGLHIPVRLAVLRRRLPVIPEVLASLPARSISTAPAPMSCPRPSDLEPPPAMCVIQP